MVGNLFGTNTGRIYLELNLTGENEFRGDLRINEDKSGLLLYDVTGSFDGIHIQIFGSPPEHLSSDSNSAPENAENKPEVEFVANLQLNSDGSFSGNWRAYGGTAGTIQLFSHDPTERISQPNSDTERSSRLHQQTRELGVLRLGLGDIRKLITLLQTELPENKVIVDYGPVENAVTVFASEFLENTTHVGDITRLRLDARTMGPDGFTRVASVEFGKFDTNEIKASGGSEVWVTGIINAVLTQLKPRQHRFANIFRKQFGNLNLLFFAALLIWLPGVELITDRLYVVLVTFCAMAALMLASTKLIPIAIIRMSSERRSFLDNFLPELITASLAALVVSGVTLVLTGLDAKGTAEDLLTWFQHLLPTEQTPKLPELDSGTD